jgi:hypothetical protein
MRPTPNLEDETPVFMFPRDRMAQLYSQAPGFLFVAFKTRRATMEISNPPAHETSCYLVVYISFLQFRQKRDYNA